jgi:hypothetical protein
MFMFPLHSLIAREGDISWVSWAVACEQIGFPFHSFSSSATVSFAASRGMRLCMCRLVAHKAPEINQSLAFFMKKEW